MNIKEIIIGVFMIASALSVQKCFAKSKEEMEIVISGGGLAGLATAKALENAGFSPVLLERREMYQLEGSGIAIPANGSWALKNIGIDIEESALPIRNMIFTDQEGNTLVDENITEIHSSGSQFYSIDRTKFIKVLKNALEKTKIKIGTWITDANTQPGKVMLTLNNGQKIDADLLIVSEGIHSKTRSLIDNTYSVDFKSLQYGADYLGIQIWRTIIENKQDIKTPVYMLGNDRVFLLYPINDNQVYVYGHIVADRQSKHVKKFDHVQDVLHTFAEFGGLAPQALSIIEATKPVIASHYLETSKDIIWSKGERVIFVGDALRGFSPMLQNGAAQAFEDAYVLQEILKENGLPNIKKVMEQYQSRRHQRAAWVKEVSDKKIVALTNTRSTDQKLPFKDYLKNTEKSKVSGKVMDLGYGKIIAFSPSDEEKEE
ncbi:uncharacterized protein LOC111320007, partial [Stylophora pistillata]|uniref:uncharacterized protein LOC111320007 n=1 Tax=Stylophora pistillata TaxID=50429 RepID=UPI000C050C5D